MAKPKAVQKKIIKIGQNIEKAIKNKGYSSIYDFWVNNPKPVAKSTLHDIVSGKSDPKISTLILLAESLNIDLSDLTKI
ncbi:MAG: helix-turn-helix transcriptional regulator [Bdellovibrionales bacterium]|nr:helix-turn-helix transcriptional regulator [Bdellovibrionales bacterium]